MLMDAGLIHRRASEIVKRCGTRSTEKIAQELGIYLHYNSEFSSLLGMYTYQHRERHILLNACMEPMLMRMVCGHEIGHDSLHRDRAKSGCMQEFELFDMRTSLEYEANAFAAHLLIDDEELLELLRQGYDVVRAASAVGTNINLMLIKLNELNRMGWHLKLPYLPRSDFLKSIALDNPYCE